MALVLLCGPVNIVFTAGPTQNVLHDRKGERGRKER